MADSKVLAFLVIVGLALEGCAPSATPTQQAATQTPTPKGGTVAMRLPGDWEAPDPARMTTATTYQVVAAMYDRLTAMDSTNGTVVPYLATAWTSPAPGSLTLTLRTGAQCSDGTAVDANVVVASLTRFSKLSINAAPLFGPGPYQFVADDATHVTMKVGTPHSTDLLLLALASPPTSIVCPAGLNADADFEKKSYGSGPFTLTSSVHGDTFTTAVRASWRWGPFGASAADPGFPESWVYRVVANESTAANLLLTGGLDLGVVTGPDVNRLLAEKSLTNKSAKNYISNTLVFNQAPGHSTADQQVRKAVMTAIDRNEYVKAATDGFGVVTTSYLTTDAPCYAPATASLLPRPSIDDAKAILLAAGYTVGSNGKLSKNGAPLTFEILGFTLHGGGPEYIGERLNQVGFMVTVSKIDRLTYIKNWSTGKFDGVLASQGSSTPLSALSVGIDYIFGALSSPANWAKVDNSTATAALQTARTTSGTESCEATKAWQTSIVQHNDVLPVGAVLPQWFGRGIEWVPDVSTIEVSRIRRKG